MDLIELGLKYVYSYMREVSNMNQCSLVIHV